MHRLAALLLCATIGGGLAAAPAPLPKPVVSGNWFGGWDSPIDHLGDCEFSRKGGKLTIKVPGTDHRDHRFDVGEGPPTAPQLLRNVQGNFVAEVKIGGGFRPAVRVFAHWAGLVVIGGGESLRVSRNSITTKGFSSVHVVTSGRAGVGNNREHVQGAPWDRPIYLRLERHGDVLVTKFSEDGKKWVQVGDSWSVKLPQQVKVGVIAESRSREVLKAEFSDFKLITLKKSSCTLLK